MKSKNKRENISMIILTIKADSAPSRFTTLTVHAIFETSYSILASELLGTTATKNKAITVDMNKMSI